MVDINEILEICKLKYPIGTKFSPIHCKYRKDEFCIITEDSEFIIYDNSIFSKIPEGIWSSKSKYGSISFNRLIYRLHVFAEIISTPELQPINDFSIW